LPLAAATAAANGAQAVGYVYSNNNTADHNSISAFRRMSDGALVELPGSPFGTGGSGTGMPVATQGALQLTADRRFIVAVDPGSNEISVLRIRSNGGLRLVDTVSSHGNVPGSLGVHGSLVYVANTGAGGMNYTGFWLQPDGNLTHINGSTHALPDTAFPGQILFSPDGRRAVGIRTGGTPTEPTLGPSQIDTFAVNADGTLTPGPGSPYASERIGPIGAQFRPHHPSQLLVTNAHDGPGLGSVSSYHVNARGRLTNVAGSPFANGETATCWVEITSDGRYLFAVNTASFSVSSYRLGAGGTLSLLGNTAIKDAVAPFDARLDPTGSYLYVIDPGGARMHAFRTHAGALEELDGSPFAIPAGGAPFGVVVI
jgi:hypothetical protein